MSIAAPISRLRRLFTLRNGVKALLWTATLILLFYAEENWRGARAWAATKAEWEAKGESFDYTKLIPPPVPDNENLAAIPLFKLEPNPAKQSFLEPAFLPRALERALRSDIHSDLPRSGNWQAGELADPGKLQKGVAALYAEAFKGAPPPASAPAQLDAIYPFLADLRAASIARPLCRFPDGTDRIPFSPPSLQLFTSQIGVAKILTLHVLLELDDHQPGPALADLKAGFSLMSGANQAPFTFCELTAIGINAIMSTAVYDGLATHAWNDGQLAEIQDELKRIDFLSTYQHNLRNEVVGEAIPLLDGLKKSQPPYLFDELRLGGGSVPLSIRLSGFWPDGWLDQNKWQRVSSTLNYLQVIDPNAHRIFPKVAEALPDQKKQADARFDAWAPWNYFFTLANRDWGRMAQTCAEAQVWADEERIACALERYRLAHGAYPDSLGALVPADADALPRDIMNGEPYHYRLRPDGTYLLYSIGWNQKDDGGKVVYAKDNPNEVDKKAGDWVWPTPQTAPEKSP